MKRALLAGVALLLWSGAARADLPVIDIGGHVISLQQLAQALKVVADDETMIANQVTQIMHLKTTVEAVMHGDVLQLANLGPELSGLGMGDLVEVGAGGAQLMDAVSGVAFATGRLSTLADRMMHDDAFYLPQRGDWSANRVLDAARLAAGRKALAVTSFDRSRDQMVALKAAREKASRAGDVTAAAQAGAALTGVAAGAQIEGNQLISLDMMHRAQDATLVSQTAQMNHCAFQRLAENAKAAQASAASGTVELVTNVKVACAGTADSSDLVASADTPGSLTSSVSMPMPLASGIASFLGQSIGSGECVALVQAADPDVGRTATWVQGDQVMGNTSLQPGTPIATFDANGRYANATDGSSHAAIYLGQDANGIHVEDQWQGQPAHERTIRFDSGGSPANSGEAFYVVSHGA